MNLYVIQNIGNLTADYHNSGGAVVVTDRDPKAVIQEYRNRLADDYGDDAVTVSFDQATFTEYATTERAERYFIFPDAGCC